MDGMYSVRFILTIVLSLVLLAASGDCVSLFFADGQGMDCCATGACGARTQTDDCCQVPLSGSAKYFQAEASVSKEIFHSYLSSSCRRVSVLLPRDAVSSRTAHSENPLDALLDASNGSLPLLI